MQLINPNYTSKIDSNEDFWKKLLQCCILYPIAKDLDHRAKMRHIEVFLFLLPSIIHLSEFDEQLWYFQLRISLKELY